MYAQIITPWSGDGIAMPFHPRVADDYGIKNWNDITAQFPVPPPINLYVVEITENEQTINAIAADANYIVLFAEPVTEPGMAG